MGTFVLGARVLLAAVFATAGVGKLLDRRGSRRALEDFGVPAQAAAIGAILLPIAELASAVALLFPPSARWGAVAALLLLLAFIVGIGRALARGETPDCHCFGQIHSSPAGVGTLVRNGALALLAAVVVAEGPGPSIVQWLGDRTGAELAAVGAGILAAVLGGIAFWLWLDNRKLRTEVDDVNAQLRALPPGLPIGVPAPAFALPDLITGEKVSLESFCAQGRPVMLIFVGPDCPGCKQLFPFLGEWQATLSARINFVPVSTGDPEANIPIFEEHGITNVVMQDAFELLAAYRLTQTPAAVVVTPERKAKIDSNSAAGMSTIETLVRLTLSRQETGDAPMPVAAEQPKG